MVCSVQGNRVQSAGVLCAVFREIMVCSAQRNRVQCQVILCAVCREIAFSVQGYCVQCLQCVG